MGKLFDKYLKREIVGSALYIPLFMATIWIAKWFGWIVIPEDTLIYLILGTIAGILTTIVSVWWNK